METINPEVGSRYTPILLDETILNKQPCIGSMVLTRWPALEGESLRVSPFHFSGRHFLAVLIPPSTSRQTKGLLQSRIQHCKSFKGKRVKFKLTKQYKTLTCMHESLERWIDKLLYIKLGLQT